MSLRLCLIVLIIFVSAGCRPSRLELEIPSSARELASSERDATLQFLRQNLSPLSYRALLDVTIYSGNRHEQFRQTVTFERPDKLRLEAFVPGINQLLFLVVAQSGLLRAINTQEKQLIYGPANARSFEYLINVPLSSEDLMVWFSGGILPSFQKLSRAKVFELSDKTLIIEAKDSSNRTLRLKTDRSSLPHFTEFSLSNDSSPFIRGTYEISSSGYPSRLTFQLKDVNGTIDVIRSEANILPKESLFTFPEPSGYTRVDIGR